MILKIDVQSLLCIELHPSEVNHELRCYKNCVVVNREKFLSCEQCNYVLGTPRTDRKLGKAVGVDQASLNSGLAIKALLNNITFSDRILLTIK